MSDDMFPWEVTEDRLDPVEIFFEQNTGFQAFSWFIQSLCSKDTAWGDQLELMLGDVYKWGQDNSNTLRSVSIGIEGGETIKVLASTQGNKYRFDFEREVTNLDIHLNHAYPEFDVFVVQAPELISNKFNGMYFSGPVFQIYKGELCFH